MIKRIATEWGGIALAMGLLGGMIGCQKSDVAEQAPKAMSSESVPQPLAAPATGQSPDTGSVSVSTAAK